MRINVYAEELTSEVEIIEKRVTNDRIGDQIFYGIRFYLVSPNELHDDPDDDDRSAITLWVPWTKAKGNNFDVLRQLISEMGAAVADAAAMDVERRS